MLKRFSGFHPICPTASSLSPLEASLQNLFHFSLEFSRGLYWAPFCSPLSNTIQKHQFDYHKYADDTELEKAALPSDFSQVSRETEVCVADVNDWMNKNKLKLNEEKTELLVVGNLTRL